jgi:3-deoxy-D-manno-octulosonate 8-phosphate phosphatase (KDO 8-P phosphatase)
MSDVLEQDHASARARRVRLMAFDVDGVLTDGSLYYTDQGIEIKAFNTLDGHGLKMLQQAGITVAIITGRSSRCVELRAQNLGIRHLFQAVDNKLEVHEYAACRTRI